MAKTNIGVIVSTYIFSLITFWSINGSNAGRSSPFLETTVVGTNSNVLKLHFYVHDTDRTLYEVAQSPITKNSRSRFDRIEVLDHKITVGPDRGSTEIGRLQRTLTTSSMEVFTFGVSLSFRFTGGEYKGSTVSAARRMEMDDLSCEMAVVGGTGLFHSATGYAIGSIYFYDDATSYTVFEFALHVESSLQHLAHDIK